MASVVIDGRYISDHYPGIGRYVFNLVKALAVVAPDHRISLLTSREAPQARFDLGELESRGVGMVPVGTPPHSPRGRLSIRRACRLLSPELFHGPHIFSATRVPCASVMAINDLIPIYVPDALPPIRHRLAYRALLRRTVASATEIITLSRAVRDDLVAARGVSPERITVVPGAADPGFRPAPVEQIAAARQRLGLPHRYVLCVGTDRPHKNLVRLVEAWTGLASDRRAGCRLVIAGPEDHRHSEIRERAAALGHEAVLVLGAIEEEDLSTLYSGARLVIQPSLYEGFGLPVIEAMACGAPVACSRTPTFDEVSGGAALQFDPTSAMKIGSAIDEALNQAGLRERLVALGLRRARELSWDRAAALTLDAYRKARDRHETPANRS